MKRFIFCWLVGAFALTALGQAQPPADSVPTAVLVDKKPHADEAENLKYYQYWDKALKQGHPAFLKKVIDANPVILRAVPREKAKDPVAWLQKHVQMEIDAKNHKLRISLPAGVKQWQQAAVNAIAKDFVAGGRVLKGKAESISRAVESQLQLKMNDEKMLNFWIREINLQKIPPDRLVKVMKYIQHLQESIEKKERKIQQLFDQLSNLASEQRLFLLEAKEQPAPKQQ